jgi:1-acyl-sn-glycerol-3-phosphate acyltransferase
MCIFKGSTKSHIVHILPYPQGDHILIDREDRRSQLKTFKDGIGWLQKGVPIMAFPEGKRSPDGRLMDFKGGIFSMAVKTKVPIIPITIGHASAIMPGNSLFPVQAGAGKLHVHVHEAIDTEGKSDAELVQLVRDAFLSTIPFSQHPLSEGEVVIASHRQDVPSLHVVQSDPHQKLHHNAHVQRHIESTTAQHHGSAERIPFFIVKEEEERELLSSSK